MILRIALAIVVIVCLALPAAASEPNPKSFIATASGANTLLAAESGRAYTIHALAVLATSDTPVSFYLHNDDNMLLGDASNKITVDAAGVGGPAGFVLGYNEKGWMATDAFNEAVEINLSGATPVIVLVLYSLRP